MATILFVDDEETSQIMYKEFLEKYGHEVQIASSEDEARTMLREQRFDLAIIDIRLTKDLHNIGGLTLAREEAHYLPKIILTHYPSQQAAELVLKVFPDGIPPAINIITKGSKYYPELLEAVKTALSLAKVWQGMVSYNTALQHDYEISQKQASAMYLAALVFAVLGAVIILFGIGSIIFMVSFSGLAQGWLLAAGSLMATLAGIITEAVGLLFFRRVDVANQRMEHYHDERIAGLRFEILYNACEHLVDIKQSIELKKSIIQQASSVWLGKVDSMKNS